MHICSCPDEKTREALKLVCDLYALDRIWKDIGTYRNVDYVAPNKAKVCGLISYCNFSSSFTQPEAQNLTTVLPYVYRLFIS